MSLRLALVEPLAQPGAFAELAQQLPLSGIEKGVADVKLRQA
jgi:hypothetical protein